MAVELASGYVSLSVKLDGATKGLGNLFDSAKKQALSAGKQTGEAYTKSLESELKKSEEQVKKFSDNVSKLRDKEADAAGKLKVALERLNEAREKGVSGSRLTNLETQHESALRKQAAAAKELARETDGLTQAQKRQERAQSALNDNLNQPKKGRFKSLFASASADAESAGTQAAGRFSSGFSNAMKTAGALAIGGGIAASMGKVVTVGLDFEKTLNTLSGVTGASADQMQRLRDTAKDLGNDVTLSNTSAADAATAMTELAKAGFSVDDSMTAAKGTLQLAAAAQVDAGQAAEIQANALQAFGLKADYAGKAADVLANAANASSAEITDVAYALQSGGSVARQTGISLEDTAASIALLANNGIKGSDAGTLLKSALLKLSAPSDQAAGALSELGVTAFDANGNFVGMETLFGQLQAASKRMTPEMYAMNTSIAFGSDAARLAGVAAKDGAAGFDQMRTAMNKQGSAAELAAAQNQGLPGVIERIKNAGETLAITIFEKIQGPLQNIGNGVNDFIGKMQAAFENPAVTQAASSIGSALSTVGSAFGAIVSAVGPALVGGLSAAVNLIAKFKDYLLPLVAAFAAYKATILVITAVTKAWVAIQGVINALLFANPIGLVIAAIAALVAGIVLLYKKNETFRNIVQAAWAGIKTAISAVWNWITTTVVPALKAAWDAIATGAMWLWNNAIKPAWEGIKAAIGVAWTAVQVYFNAWKTAVNALGAVFSWLWQNIVQPIWNNIKILFAATWDAIQPIITLWKAEFSALGAAATWLWENALKPAWEAIKTGFSAGWDFVKGIFDKLKDGFQGVSDFVKTVWNGLGAIVKAALNKVVDAVRGPIHTIGGMLANIPTGLGPFEIPGAEAIKGLGQKMQAFAGGGVVRGPGTGTSDSILAWLSNGEGVVTAKAMNNGGGLLVAALNAGWVPSAEYLRGMMLPGYAEGLNPGADWLRSKVMELWPQIRTIGGRRSEDGFGEHSSGNAIDIMIPNYNTDEGLALGNSVLAFLQKNGAALDVDGIIWRQTSYGYGHGLSNGKGMSDRGSPTQNHMDHLHVILGGGRGAGAAPVGIPTASLSLPTGGSISPSGGGSSGGGSSGSRGGATPKQLREADDRVTDLQNRLDIAEQELADVENDPKAKDTSKQRKRDQVDKLKRELQQAKDDKTALENRVDTDLGTGGSSGRNSGNDPFSKILDGFGELADTAVGGIKETLLPEGFSDPTQWGLLQAGGGLLNFFAGLSPDPVARGILGAFGNGLTGNASGAIQSIGGIFQPPADQAQMRPDAAITGATDGSQHAGLGTPPGPVPPGGPLVQNNFNGNVGVQPDAVINAQNAGFNTAWRRNLGTVKV